MIAAVNLKHDLKEELLLPVEGHRQKRALCGWASLKMVLKYYGLDVGEQFVYELSGSSKKDGADADDIIAVAEHDFKLKGVKWDWCKLSDIAAWLLMDVPVIVDYFIDDEGHYSVAVGIKKGQIAIMDPQVAKIVPYATRDFMRMWHDFKGDYPKSKDDYITRRLIAIYDPELLPGLEPYDELANKHKPQDVKHKLFISKDLESRLNAIGLHYLQR
jgi:hypothetical protein